jgi:1A family penicillin-binding protein
MTRRRRRRASYRISRRWRRRSRNGLRKIFLIAFVVVFMLPLMTLPAVAATTVGTLPSVDGLSTSALNQDMLIYDRNGTLLADIGDQGDHRIVVPLSYVSPLLVQATIAVEDHSFYTNNGVDIIGIIRAALADTKRSGVKQGGSTISQQLVKQVFIGPNPPPTIQRKMREALLALELNKRYNKQTILEMYLNTIYYGNQTYGVEAAARSYFRSNAHDLTLAQASLLAGLPQAPTAYNPLLNLPVAKQRQAQVLQTMVAQKVITHAQAEAALAEKLTIYPPANRYKAPYFVDYVLRTLSSKFNIDPSQHKGYRITTSLDLNLQHLAEQVVNDQIASKCAYYNFHDAALVSMDPKTGEIVAMVGGYDYNAPGGQINMANSPRQPGSSFKIFTYTAAIESGKFNMMSPILDEPMVFPVYGGVDGYQPYAPQNYDGRYHGTLPLKMAMGNSLNIPAVKTELRIGIPAVLSAARRMGVTHLTAADDTYGFSLTLGSKEVTPVDMVTGISTLAAQGVRHTPAPVLAIVDGLGRKIYTYDAAKNAYQAVSPEVAFIIASIMSDDRNRCMSFGCNGDLTLPGRHVAAKTGTTQSFHDNWTVGFTPTLATAVWVGNPDNAPLNHNSTGIVGAAPIWHKFMQQALASTPDQWYAVPAGIHQVGGNFYLPGTESGRTILAQPWPGCPFGRYNPYTLTYDQMLVGGVPCVLRRAAAPPPKQG